MQQGVHVCIFLIAELDCYIPSLTVSGEASNRVDCQVFLRGGVEVCEEG